MNECHRCKNRYRPRALFLPSAQGGAQWTCTRCWTPEEKELIGSLDERARNILPRTGGEPSWPYGPNISVQSRIDLVRWAEEHQLAQSTSRCSSGLHWLEKGRCAKNSCTRRLPFFYDHTTLWFSSVTRQPRLILSQPYAAPEPTEVAEFIAPHPGLRYEIGKESWYGNGTVTVCIWRDE